MATPAAPAPPQPVLCDFQIMDAPNGVKIVAMVVSVIGAGISFSWAMEAAQAETIGKGFIAAAAKAKSGLILPPGSGRITPPGQS